MQHRKTSEIDKNISNIRAKFLGMKAANKAVLFSKIRELQAEKARAHNVRASAKQKVNFQEIMRKNAEKARLAKEIANKKAAENREKNALAGNLGPAEYRAARLRQFKTIAPPKRAVDPAGSHHEGALSNSRIPVAFAGKGLLVNTKAAAYPGGTTLLKIAQKCWILSRASSNHVFSADNFAGDAATYRSSDLSYLAERKYIEVLGWDPDVPGLKKQRLFRLKRYNTPFPTKFNNKLFRSRKFTMGASKKENA